MIVSGSVKFQILRQNLVVFRSEKCNYFSISTEKCPNINSRRLCLKNVSTIIYLMLKKLLKFKVVMIISASVMLQILRYNLDVFRAEICIYFSISNKDNPKII